MKKSVYFLMFAIVSLIAWSINLENNKNIERGNISGKLVESSSKETIDNALVTVSDNGKVIAQTTVKEDGTFTFSKLPNKILNLSIENVAYTTVNKTIDLVNASSFNFGNISLDTQVNILEELIIVVKRR